MELINKNLTEQIIAILFEVYNHVGWGYREEYYERAIKEEATSRNIYVNSQKSIPLLYKGKKIGRRKFDLVFFKEILVELKVGEKLIPRDFDQINEYLKALNLQVGLLVLFSPEGVKFRRIVNLHDYKPQVSD